jgi:hypothetical protein
MPPARDVDIRPQSFNEMISANVFIQVGCKVGKQRAGLAHLEARNVVPRPPGRHAAQQLDVPHCWHFNALLKLLWPPQHQNGTIETNVKQRITTK